MKSKSDSIDTKLIHAGEISPRIEGAISLPVFQTSIYEFEEGLGYHDIPYIRMNNTPNHIALHGKLAALENAEAALVTASGMAAISTTLLAVLSSGDHFLVQDCLYGGTHDFITQDLPSLNINYDFIKGSAPETWEEKLRPGTKAFYVESLTNPLLEVTDLESVVEFCREHGLIAIIDNTFTTPVNYRPSEHGFDLSIHSCSKYLNGHSDIVGGAVIGSADLLKKVTHKLNHLGGSMDPHTCYLLHRGLRTLALRVRCQNQSALQIARFLSQHPEVAKVNYPGLESHPGHDRAAKLFDGFGGMISFELKGGIKAVDKLLDRLNLVIVAPSLGGIETLVTKPASTSHAGMTSDELKEVGITETLIRVSTGIEAPEDLIADFDQAISR
ncbi:MAG: aminotransferase class I/II-fold pyridoxal phosphate-dependent enzyme [Candidatus Aminicenantes bacterium]|nr:aminotransferase class I/II-fold pyridoxal phosphate-dependent enzyme [Candidatus Aminicenantes bacterium]